MPRLILIKIPYWCNRVLCRAWFVALRKNNGLFFCVCCQLVLNLHLIGCGGLTGFISHYIGIDMEKNDAKKGKAPVKGGKKFVKMVRLVAINVVAVAVLMVALSYCALKWTDSYTRHGEACEVPNVCGLELEDATGVLAGRGLDHSVVERRHKPGAVENEIIMQYPEPGSMVKEGRKVGLVVNSTEKPKRTIPSVIDNRTYREAESHIRAAGFVIEKVDTVAGEKDWVYEMRYNNRQLKNGEAIPQGSKVTVVVGNGKALADEDEPVFDENFGI